MTNSSVLIVGSGISGLTLASILADEIQSLIVIDRLPVIGGINAGYENRLIKHLHSLCQKPNIHFMLGTTAIRWKCYEGYGELLIVGPRGMEWLKGKRLVYAGGIRPSTLAELSIVGDRLSGVLPCTVAYHLLENGVRLGRKVVILGNSDWAGRIITLMKKRNYYVSVIPFNDGHSRDILVDEWWSGWSPLSIHGKGHIEEIIIGKNELRERIICDALILAARMRPMRNIDGAVFEHLAKNVTFVQLVGDNTKLEDRFSYSSTIANELVEKIRRKLV